MPPLTAHEWRHLSLCSPEGIRTLVADLRSQSPGPLDDGAPVLSIPHDLAVIGSEFPYSVVYCAGVPGLEPRLTEPESAGLPITPYPTIFIVLECESLPDQ